MSVNWIEDSRSEQQCNHLRITCSVPLNVRIVNLHDGDTVPHSLLLLCGYLVRPICVLPCYVSLTLDGHKSKCTRWYVNRRGVFKALTWLRPGENRIQLSIGVASHQFTITYRTLSLTRFVRPVYLLCKDSDGKFQCDKGGGEDNSLDSARRRICLAVHLLQMYVAEQMCRAGFGRKTFRVASSPCEVFRSALTEREARGMSQNELWRHFGKELMSSEQFGEKSWCKWVVIMSFTRYRPRNGSAELPRTYPEVLQHVTGHAALGGGGLALFGSGCLYAWPRDVQEVQERFNDDRMVDRRTLMDDSANRGTYGACFSTTLGAVLHELGHTLDMGHTPTGIMDRGFDHIAHFYTVNDNDTQESLMKATDHRLNGKVCSAVWYRCSIVLLNYHKWLNDCSDSDNSDSVIRISDQTVTSRNGITLVEYRDSNGTTISFDEYPTATSGQPLGSVTGGQSHGPVTSGQSHGPVTSGQSHGPVTSGQSWEATTRVKLRDFSSTKHRKYTVLVCDSRGNILKRDY